MPPPPLRMRRTTAIAMIASVGILALVVISVVVLPEIRGPSNGACPSSGGCAFAANVEIAVESDYGAGMIIIKVTDSANYAFTNITLTDVNPGLAGLAVFAPFTSNARLLGPTNVLGIGENTTGEYSFISGGSSRTLYTVTLAATLTDGQIITEKGTIVSDG